MPPTLLRALCGLCIVLAVPVAARAGLKRVLFVGDSTTANILLLKPRHLYPEVLAHRLGIVAQNLAAPGSTMASGARALGYERFGGGLQIVSGPLPARGVVVLLGTNDWQGNVPRAAFRAAYDRLLRDIPPWLFVVCITPLWRADETVPNGNGDRIADFRGEVAGACSGRTVVDGLALIPAEPRFFIDGLHPNDAGTLRMAHRLEKILRPLLR